MIKPLLEKVLCSPTAELPRAWLPDAGAVVLEEAALLAGLASHSAFWLPRDRAEKDYSYKQWIPYVILKNQSGEVACYSRHGNETRLHGQLSLGIGGHINPEDDGVDLDRASRWRHLFRKGMERELAEEYPGAVEGKSRFAGIVHESESNVGKVHIGLVFIHELGSDPGIPGPELKDFFWTSPHALISSGRLFERLELWSRLALELFDTHQKL